MSGICLAAGVLVASLGNDVTVRWLHSIEKARWEEDYRSDGRALQLVEARVRGTGAGMEPPQQAVFRDGAWHYRPRDSRHAKIALSHSPYAEPYVFCGNGVCRTASEWLSGLPAYAVLTLAPCTRPGS